MNTLNMPGSPSKNSVFCSNHREEVQTLSENQREIRASSRRLLLFQWKARFRRHSPRAFTLIELLVVIAIIALLAGLVVYLLPSITEKKVRGRVKAELAALDLAINTYKSKIGFYPPDNPNDSAQSPLYYELTGTERIQPPQAAPIFRDRDRIVLTTNIIGTYFATSGFINSDPEARDRKDFCPNLKTNTSYRTIGGSSPGVQLLMVPYKGTNGDFNPWHYNSSSPQHNLESFDLWAVVVVGNKTITIGNWKE